MKSVLVGVGQAGGKVTQALTEYDSQHGYGTVVGALAINTAEPDLKPLTIPKLLIGQDRVGGHGVGADNELATEIMSADIDDVMEALDGRVTAKAESVFVVAGLGGGTGSGGAPMLVHELKRVYDVPVYALGILPGRDEGSIYQVNAGRSLKTIAREADATLLVSNDAWRASGESVEEGFDAINRRIADRVGLVMAAGELTGAVAESVVDSSEVINTLRPGKLASIGYADAEAAEEAVENVHTIMSTTRNAVLNGTSLPKASTAEAGLFIVAGDPDRISRKGVERARKWMEDELGCMQVRGGDFPLSDDRIRVIVVMGGIERSERITELMDRAREGLDRRDDGPDATEALLNDDLDGLI